MINFFKEDEIGKIAFASGDVYTPQGNVTLLLDATTKQIIVAEDERPLYYVPLSDTLQVNGEEITGTDAQKLALIAPIFQGAAGTGGGTGGRFGVAGEDATATQERVFDAAGNLIRIAGIDYFTIDTVDPLGSGKTVTLTIGREGSWKWEDETGDNAVKMFAGVLVTDEVSKPTAYLESSDFANDKINGVYVDRDGIKVTLEQFANNADAVSALGVGRLYFNAAGDVKLTAAEVTATAPKLLSPDGTTWTIGITNEGAINATSGGTGGQASFTLNSPDGATWTITISNEGVLSQSKP